ncbi:MAG: deoxyribodipyrimidine photo-lyase, partial [Halolamina sp.]
MQLFWHRRDLRASDNRGLAAAADSPGPTVPVFVFDDDVLDHGSDPRVRFMLDSLAELQERYRESGSNLVVARGDPAAVLPVLAQALDAETVCWNEDYSGLAQERDGRVRDALDRVGVARETHHDGQLHEPGTIRTNDGDPYQVYTYFWKKWRDREKPAPFAAPEAEALADAETLAVEKLARESDELADALRADLPTIDALGFADPEADVQAAGTDAARERLETFCDERIFRYEDDREYPAKDGSSRLSPHLRFGTIGLREVYAATEAAMAEAAERDEGEDGTAAQDSVETFQSQLAWREFYTQV